MVPVIPPEVTILSPFFKPQGLKKGDKIVTSGGITGTITRVVDNDKIEVEVAENVTVEVIRGTGVQSLMNSQEVKK